MDAKPILDRWQELADGRAAWDSHWQEVLDYTLPARGRIHQRTAGAKRTELLFDGTAPDACELLAATLSSSMTPAADRWFEHEAEGLEDDDEVRGWLERADDKLFAALADSNFYHQLHETYLDDVTVGTSALLCEERPIERAGFNGFAFRALTVGEYCIGLDAQGLVDTVYRRWTWSARQAAQAWGEDAGEQAFEAARERPDEPFEFIHAVYPRSDRADHPRATAMPFASCTVNVKESHLVRESGYAELPYGVARWSVMSGEQYGRSPSMKALPDIKTLNLINRYGLEALPLYLYPPFLVQEGTLASRLKLTPGATNVFDGRADQKPQSLRLDGRPEIEVATREYYEAKVRGHYNVDKFRLKDSPAMTATEVLARQEELTRVLGPNVGRLQGEKLKPVIERCFLMMHRAGSFGPPPLQLAQATAVNLRYLGPLARAQRLAKVRRIQAAFADIGPMAQLNPQVMDLFDLDAAARLTAREHGLPVELVRPERAVGELRAARAQAQAAAAQQQLGLQVTDRLIAGAKAVPGEAVR
jgi:hypothetical protein